MQGAPVDVQDKSGHYPIHLAVQTNSIDCVMVLLRIGVDVNVVSRHGYTPLFLAKANNLKHIESLLIENKAVMTILPAGDPPDATILDAIPETRTKDKKKISALEDLLNMPSKYDFY